MVGYANWFKTAISTVVIKLVLILLANSTASLILIASYSVFIAILSFWDYSI